MRVTGIGGTAILNADPDEWTQVANLPGSITWDPGTGAALPVGDPTNSWIIDNDFLLSLGPVASGIKTITIEWLTTNGTVVDVFQVNIPCDLSDKEADFETNWEAYTTVVSGGTCVSVYLEPDDCDNRDFEVASCSINMTTPVCVNHQYQVTFSIPANLSASSYQWTVDSVVDPSSNTNVLATSLQPGAHSIIVDALDSNTQSLGGACSRSLDLRRPLPDFAWQVDGCTKTVFLDGSITENSNDVTLWEWTCPAVPAVQIPDGENTVADFSALPEGSYNITLHVTDNVGQPGCTWEQTYSVYIGGCTPSWEPKYSWCVEQIDPSARANVTVTFLSTPGGCGPFTWEWYFDATSQTPDSNLPNPTYVYQNALDGEGHLVTLKFTDNSNGCHSTVQAWIKITQKEMPKFTVKVCPDGKVICETSEPHPVWTATGSPDIAPWPYTKDKKHRSRIIYRYDTPGTYTVTLTTTNDYGNECESRKKFTVLQNCCAKNAHTRKISSPIYVQVNGHPATLRVKGKLRQLQGPFWHRVKAKTILQRRNSNFQWRRFKSSDVEIVATFGPTGDWSAAPGTVYRSEQGVLAFDGFHFTGCNCVDPVTTFKEKRLPHRRKVRAVDGVGGRFRSKLNSIQSHHGVRVGAASNTSYPLTLSLGEESDCGEAWNWWRDWIAG